MSVTDGVTETQPVDESGAVSPSRRSGLLRPSVAVALAYVASRLAYAAAGVRFQAGHADAYIHFLDRDVLRDDLVGSLWYDHAQPPGLNAIWALALRLSPTTPANVLWPIYLATGLAIALVLFHLLVRVGLRSWVAAAVSIAWTVSPSAVLMETYFLYTPFEVLGLLAVLLLVARWAQDHRLADAVGLAVVVSALALTRASFHLLWIVGLFVLLGALRRPWWRQLAWTSLIPLVLVGGWYTKNAVIFGQFGPSSWMGNNLSRVTVEQLPDAEREQRSREGQLSPFAPYRAFSSLEEMGMGPLGSTEPRSNAPMLDRRLRLGTPFANTRHRDYLVVSEARLDDSAWVVRHRPGAYARGVGRATSVTFGASADYFGYGPNVDRIGPLVTAERWMLGGWSPLPQPDDPTLGRWSSGAHEWVVLAGYLAAMVGVPLMLARRWRQRGTAASATVVALAAWCTVGYLTALGILAEFGENNRFRSVTDPAVLVLLAWLWATYRGAHPFVLDDEAADPVPAASGDARGPGGGADEGQ